MKCPCCNGTGRTPMVTIVKTDSGLPCDFPCIECDGTGEVEMTNEYFLQTATAEELAKFLSTIAYACMRCGMTNSKAYCHTNFCIQDKEDALRWLKQPHTIKE